MEDTSSNIVRQAVCETHGHNLHSKQDDAKTWLCLNCGMTLEEIRGETTAKREVARAS